MNDETTAAGPGPSTAVALRPQRAIVEDVVPIFDTGDFEHMQRIAGAMAMAPLVPNALKGQSLMEAQANCLMVVNQARNWRMDPFAVAQCCFVTKGKLGYEGKLVAAVIKSRVGVDLHYWFTGKKGSDDYRVFVSDEPFTPEVIAELEPGKAYLGRRIIDGSVGEWKTSNDNWKQQPDMQLRYRGGRVWCRAYEPAILLGVYADDELEQIADRRERFASGEVAPGGTRVIGSGFGDETDQNFRRPQGGPQTASGGGGSSGAADTSEGPSASAGAAGGGKSGETVQDAHFEEIRGDDADAEGLTGASEAQDKLDAETAEEEKRPTETGGAPSAESEQASSGSATAASSASAAEIPGPSESSKPSASGAAAINEGPAPAGVAYFWAGDTSKDGAGRRPTYKDGALFSSAVATGKTPVYAEHPAKVEVAEAGDAGEAQSAEAPPAKEETTTTATTSKSPPSSDASPGQGDPFDVCREAVLASSTWLGIKQHLRTLARAPEWREADDEGRRMAQAEAWDRYREIRNEGQEIANPVDDLSLFALWLNFGAETKDEVEQLFATFMRKPAYKEAKDGDKDWVRSAVAQRLAALS